MKLTLEESKRSELDIHSRSDENQLGMSSEPTRRRWIKLGEASRLTDLTA
jgi:hypothetical protein